MVHDDNRISDAPTRVHRGAFELNDLQTKIYGALEEAFDHIVINLTGDGGKAIVRTPAVMHHIMSNPKTWNKMYKIDAGTRCVLITIDTNGTILSAGDEILAPDESDDALAVDETSSARQN